MQGSIGQIFQEARERKGVSLSQAAADTRIKPTQMAAMERGDFSSMAAPLYVKGFIRIYAKYLGLDPLPLLEQVFARPEETPGIQPLAPENTSRMLQKKTPPSPELAPPVDRFAAPGDEASMAPAAPAYSVPGPRVSSTVRSVPASDRGSVTARRLAEAQSALGGRRPAPVPAVPPETSGAPPAARGGLFHFPESPARENPPPARAPDLFDFAQRPPAPRPEPPTTPSPPEVVSPDAAAVKAAVAADRLSAYKRPRWRASPPADPNLPAPPRFRLPRLSVPFRREWVAEYGPRAVAAAGVVLLVVLLALGVRACRSHQASRPPRIPADAPSGIWAEPPDPYLEPAPAAAAHPERRP